FFFQAEDGIRDFHVTGVQTCALPIWLIPENPTRLVNCDDPGKNGPSFCAFASLTKRRIGTSSKLASGLAYPCAIGVVSRNRLGRSEERRVGEECRSRRAAESDHRQER